MNDYNDYPCEHRSTKFVCFNIFFTIIAVAAMGLLCILFCTHRAGLTLELDNKRAAAISNNETVLWNKTITSVNSDITYDETTGQITFHRSGYYYINYYFNVIPNTVNTDFGFALSDASSQKLMANGGQQFGVSYLLCLYTGCAKNHGGRYLFCGLPFVKQCPYSSERYRCAGQFHRFLLQ